MFFANVAWKKRNISEVGNITFSVTMTYVTFFLVLDISCLLFLGENYNIVKNVSLSWGHYK